MKERVDQLERELQAVYRSRSWKMTFILRFMNSQYRALREQGFRVRVYKMINKMFKIGHVDDVHSKLLISVFKRPKRVSDMQFNNVSFQTHRLHIYLQDQMRRHSRKSL